VGPLRPEGGGQWEKKEERGEAASSDDQPAKGGKRGIFFSFSLQQRKGGKGQDPKKEGGEKIWQHVFKRRKVKIFRNREEGGGTKEYPIPTVQSEGGGEKRKRKALSFVAYLKKGRRGHKKEEKSNNRTNRDAVLKGRKGGKKTLLYAS